VARRAVKKGTIFSVKQGLGMGEGLPSLALDVAGVAWEATESADTRCWSLLPDRIQVLRLELPVGSHTLLLRPLDRQGQPLGQPVPQTVTVADGRNSYLLLQAEQHLPQSLRAKVGPSDIVQETAIDAHRDFLRFRGTTQEELYAWLRTILQNNVMDAVRRFEMTQKRAVKREASLSVVVDRRGISVLPVGSTTPDHSAIRREDAALLAGLLTRVPDDYQTVLRLRYWDGLTFPQIATRIGRSEEAARKLWYRALARLTLELQALAAEQRKPPLSS
jgi:RNA polymerase sigma-70 factor (ECF subfamily)